MNYKTLRKELEKYKAKAFVNKQMKEHYSDLFDVAVSELKFERLNKDFLKSLLDEVEALATDEILLAVIENWKNRAELDNIIHLKTLFPDECKKKD